MKVNLITCLNGVGLQTEVELFREFFEARGDTLREYDHRGLERVPEADLNIFDEFSVPAMRQFAPRNVIMVHPEWSWPKLRADLAGYDAVLCKTKDAHRTFSLFAPHAVYVGMWSRDLYDAKVKRRRAWIHSAGGSLQKNTEAIIEAWRRFPDLPPLLIHSKRNWGITDSSKLKFIGEVTEDQLRQLLNEHVFQLQPSAYEGFGHLQWEAMSARAVVITMDAPPMNEAADPALNHIRPVRFFRWREATVAGTTPEEIAHAVREADAMSDAEIEAAGDRARAKFLANRAIAQQKFAEQLSSFAQPQAILPRIILRELAPEVLAVAAPAKKSPTVPTLRSNTATSLGALAAWPAPALPEGEGRGWYLEYLLDHMLKLKGLPLEILETGCLRSATGRIGDGHSTYYIARWVKKNGGHFTSIDHDPASIGAARNYLSSQGLLPYADLICEDSLSAILKPLLARPLDFALLDSAGIDTTAETSANNLNLREYRAVSKRLRRPGIVVIDDCNEVPGFPFPLKGYCKGKESLHVAAAQGDRILALHRFAVILHGCGTASELENIKGQEIQLPAVTESKVQARCIGFILPSYPFNRERAVWAKRSFTSLAKSRILNYKPRIVMVARPGVCDPRTLFPKMQQFDVEILEQPKQITFIDAAFTWGLDHLFRNYPWISHGGIVQDDFIYNPNWLRELDALISRRPNALNWWVYRSNNERYSRTIKSDGADHQVTCVNGPGVMTREEWRAWGLDYHAVDFGLDVTHPKQRPGERWVTAKSYIQSIGVRGVHNTPEEGEAAIGFVGE